MAERISPTITVDEHQALVAIPQVEDGQEVTVYFVDGDAPDQTVPEQVQDALDLAGAWSDLDWHQTEQALERIRHQSTPTPSIDEV